MDEPFSALDPISRVQLQNELKKLNQQLKKTIIFVTHDIEEALKIADQIILLYQGQVVQYATPAEILKNPANEFVRQFIGEERYQSIDSVGLGNRRMVSN
jgi:osmoprotectant transport system ATP-binding protein